MTTPPSLQSAPALEPASGEPAPDNSSRTEQVLRDHGFGTNEIAALRAERVIK